MFFTWAKDDERLRPVIVTPADDSRQTGSFQIQATWPSVDYGYPTKVALIARLIGTNGVPGQPWTIVYSDFPDGVEATWKPPYTGLWDLQAHRCDARTYCTYAAAIQDRSRRAFFTYGSAAGSCPGTTFTDVRGDHAFCTPIAWLATHGISTGTKLADGSVEFRPVAAVSRSAMAAFLHRAAGSPPFSAPSEPSFADVPVSHQFYEQIEWMKARGISTGYDNPAGGKKLYKPLDPVARQAMAPFLYRAAGSPAFDAPASPSFADVPVTHPFFAEIEWMRATGISTGTPQSTGGALYKPADAVSRQAMAAFLKRLYVRS